MNYLSTLLLMLLSFSCVAGYTSNNTEEMGKTADSIGTKYVFYSTKIQDSYAINELPLCGGRKHMIVTTGNQFEAATGCWWVINKEIVSYSPLSGIVIHDINLMMLNSNFMETKARGF